MTALLERREFITVLGGAAAVWAIAARAQQTKSQLVGVLHSRSATVFAPFMVAFRQGLTEQGLPSLRGDLRWWFGTGSQGGNLYDTILFTTGEDPVKAGLVPSLNRPGSNVTGLTLFYVELGAKLLEVLRELSPKPR